MGETLNAGGTFSVVLGRKHWNHHEPISTSPAGIEPDTFLFWGGTESDSDDLPVNVIKNYVTNVDQAATRLGSC